MQLTLRTHSCARSMPMESGKFCVVYAIRHCPVIIYKINQVAVEMQLKTKVKSGREKGIPGYVCISRLGVNRCRG